MKGTRQQSKNPKYSPQMSDRTVRGFVFPLQTVLDSSWHITVVILWCRSHQCLYPTTIQFLEYCTQIWIITHNWYAFFCSGIKCLSLSFVRVQLEAHGRDTFEKIYSSTLLCFTVNDQTKQLLCHQQIWHWKHQMNPSKWRVNRDEKPLWGPSVCNNTVAAAAATGINRALHTFHWQTRLVALSNQSGSQYRPRPMTLELGG